MSEVPLYAPSAPCAPSVETFKDAVKRCRTVELTFHEPVSREIRDGFAGTSQRTAVVPAKTPGAARFSLSLGFGRHPLLQRRVLLLTLPPTAPVRSTPEFKHGSPKVNFPSRPCFSKVEIVFNHVFE